MPKATKIPLKGSVDFTMSDNNLYIRDIRRRKAGSTEQGTTIDNFLPGFVESTSFILKLGPLEADSDFELVIDVVNTTETTYQVNTTYNVTNGTIKASGKIEGDGVPLAQVTTADISGQIILNVTITSAGIVDLDQVDIPLTEYIPQVYDYFTFKANCDGKTVTLTAFDQSKADTTDIVIPAKVDLVDGVWQDGNTYTVTIIADGGSNTGVFEDSGITSVTFPSSLTSIGIAAFKYCSGLTSISLPSSLTSIGSNAFGRCSGLTGELDFSNCTSLTSIGSYAFQYCSGLTGELNLGGCTSLTSIGERAFSSCSRLTSVDLSGCTSLTSIGSFAFYGCRALESVVFPEGSTGCYVTQDETATSGDSVTVTDPSVNADNLTGQYEAYYWKRG